MLLELNIEHFVVADRLRLRFGPGLNLLTGETGSGKSIIVDALSLLLGARAGVEVIRPGQSSARVSGVFSTAESPELKALLDAAGLDFEQGELIVDREVLESGKSRAYINGRPVTLTRLRELAPFLGDIHGQHEQQHLFSTRAQLDMLDAFAETEALAAEVASLHALWRDGRKRLEELRGDEQERLRQLDLYEFQVREIEQAAPRPGEGEEIEQERRLLGNLERVQQTAASAYDRLYDSTVSAATQLKAARRSIEELAQFDAAFRTMLETLDSSQAGVDDTAFELRAYLDRLEPDPARLEQIEDRVALLKQLQRKYGGSLEEVLAYGEQARGRVEELRSSDEAAAELEARQEETAEKYEAAAEKLSARRRQAAGSLEVRVEAELRELAMERARFQIGFEATDSVGGGQAGWSARGIDRVRFLVSANPGQPPRPLARVASGGELSRVTLALKTCLVAAGDPGGDAAGNTVPRTLVFDEIDSGVGGRVAEAVGRRLEKLAAEHQLLCVTHLAPIAGFADVHFVVDKQEIDGATVASVKQLSGKQRIEELARMLSGETITTAALRHAKQMIKREGKAATG